MSYTSEVLNSIVSSDEAVIVLMPEKLGKDARIHFVCKCGTEHNKTFRYLKVSGMLCDKCTMASKKNKAELTNLAKYGNKCTLQANSIKKKAEETCMQRYGVKNPFQSDTIIEKIKETNVKKYGAKNPFGSKIVKEKLRKTCKEKYGTEFPMQNKEVASKTKETNLQKYGVPVSSQADCLKEKAKETNLHIYGCEHHAVPEVLNKAKVTNMQKYGVEHSFQAESVKEKIKETILERYGVEHNMKSPEIRCKVRESNIKKFGVDHPLKSDEILQKQHTTNIERYGVKHAMQSSEVQEKVQKGGLRFKEYTTPSGYIWKVQGYEPMALDILLKEFAEDDIITSRKEVPRIIYTKADGAEHYHFPDVWIKSCNKLIEVKSTWTYKLHEKTNELKWNAAKKAGHDMECWIFNAKGQLTKQCITLSDQSYHPCPARVLQHTAG